MSDVGGGGTFEIRVLTEFDTASFQTYIAEVKAGLAELEAQASAGTVTPAETATRAGAVQGAVAESSANLGASAAGLGGSIGADQLATMDRQLFDLGKQAAVASGAETAAKDALGAAETAAAEVVQESIKANQEQIALLRAQAAEGSGYAESVAQLAAALNESTARVYAAKAADDQYIDSTVELARTRAQASLKESQALAASPEATQALGAAGAQQQVTTASVNAAQAKYFADNPQAAQDLVDGTAAATAARKTQAASIDAEVQAELAVNSQFINDSAAAATSKKELAAKTLAATLALATTPEGEAAAQLGITNTVKQRFIAEQEKLGIARATLANEDGEIGLIAERKVAEAQLNAAIDERVAAELKALNETRAQAGQKALSIGGGGGGGKGAGSLLSGLFGDGGVSGAVDLLGSLAVIQGGFKLFTGLSDAVKEATALNLQLTVLQSQAQAIGQGDSFGALRSSILATSASTGVAADQVASLAGEFLGLYQNTALAAGAADSAAKLIRVIGGSAATEGPQIAALADDLHAGVSAIGNAVLDIQDKTGRAGLDALAAMGQLAPVANELGLSLNETRGLIEAVGVGSAKSGQQIGEGLARILPQLIKDLPKLSRDGIVFNVQARTGDAKAALEDIFKSFQSGNLSTTQKSTVISDLGGPRNAQILAAALADPKRALDALNGSVSDNNLLNERNAAAQDTLKGAFDRFKETMVTLGEALLHSGIQQFFIDVITIGGAVISVVEKIIGGFDRFSNLLGGFPARLVEVIVALKVLQSINALGLLTSGGELFISTMTSGQKAVGGLIARMTGLFAAKEADNAATAESIITEGVATAGVVAHTGAEELDTASIVANDLAKGAGGVAGAAGRAGRVATFAEPFGAEAEAASAAGGPLVIAGVALAAVVLTVGDIIKKRTNAKVKTLLTQYDTASDAALAQAVKDNAKVDPLGDSVRGQARVGIAIGTLGVSEGVTAAQGFIKQETGINLPNPIRALQDRIFGSSSGSKGSLAAQTQQARAVNAQSDELQNLIDVKAGTPAQLAALQTELANPGNKADFTAGEAALTAITGTEKGKKADDLFKALKKQNELLKGLGDTVGEVFTQASEVVTAFQGGNIDYSTALNDINTIIASEQGDALAVQRAKDTAAGVKLQEGQAYVDIQNRILFLKDVAGGSPADVVTLLTSQLSGVAAEKYSSADKEKLADQLTKADKTQSDYNVAHATSIAAIRAIQQAGTTTDLNAADTLNAFDQSQGLTPRYTALAAQEAAAQPQITAEKRVLNRSGEVQGQDYTLQDLERQAGISSTANAALSLDAFDTSQTKLASLGASIGAREVALATAAGASLNALAAIIAKNDQATLDQLEAADKNQGVDPAADAAVQAAIAKVQADAVTIQADAITTIKSRAGYYKALAAGDSIKQAEIDRKAANDELRVLGKTAQQAAADVANGSASTAEIAAATDAANAAQQGIAAAQSYLSALDTFYKTLYRDNPLAGAQQSLTDINAQIAILGTTGSALVAAVRSGADKNPQDIGFANQYLAARQALNDQKNAMASSLLHNVELAQTASGDSVGAARTQVAEIRQKINQLVANGATVGNSSQLIDLQGQLLTATDNVEKTRISTTEAQIATDVSLHRYGLGTAIRRLELLRASAIANKDSQEKIDQISQQIAADQQQASGQLSFNVGNITLPTLYEAKRLAAAAGGPYNGSNAAGAAAGAGAFTDNRQQAITIQINNAQDNAGAVTQLLAAVGGPSRVGAALPRFT